MRLAGVHLGPPNVRPLHAWRRPGLHPTGANQPAENLPEAELRKAVKHVHNEAKLYPGRARRGLPPDPSSDAPGPLTIHPASAVNESVNENLAQPCRCLLSWMPSDQHRHRVCPLLHTGSSD
jgi:hypothetical protein